MSIGKKHRRKAGKWLIRFVSKSSMILANKKIIFFVSVTTLNSIKIQCHKRFHLKPKAAINCIEISSVICKTILIFNSYTDEIIILLNFIFTGLHGYQITPSSSTNKQRHRLLLLKTGITVAPTHL